MGPSSAQIPAPLPKVWGRPGGARSTSLTGRLLCFLQICYVCGERGATITCQGKKCKRSFHFPCGRTNGCISQFFGQYR